MQVYLPGASGEFCAGLHRTKNSSLLSFFGFGIPGHRHHRTRLDTAQTKLKWTRHEHRPGYARDTKEPAGGKDQRSKLTDHNID